MTWRAEFRNQEGIGFFAYGGSLRREAPRESCLPRRLCNTVVSLAVRVGDDIERPAGHSLQFFTPFAHGLSQRRVREPGQEIVPEGVETDIEAGSDQRSDLFCS
jgi:hypothetical protein